MNEASKRRRELARHEASLTGRTWVSDRARKRARRAEQLTHHNGTQLLETAAAFALADDKARGRKVNVRIMRATGDGGPVEPKEPPCITYNESARGIMGY